MDIHLVSDHFSFESNLLYVGRQFISAEASYEPRITVIAIPYLHKVVGTPVVLLQLKALELQGHLVVIRSRDPPHALFVRHVVHRIVGRVYGLIFGQL